MVSNDGQEGEKKWIVVIVGRRSRDGWKDVLLKDHQRDSQEPRQASVRCDDRRPAMIKLHKRNDPSSDSKDEPRVYACREETFRDSDVVVAASKGVNRLCEIQTLSPSGCGDLDDEQEEIFSSFLIKTGSIPKVTGHGKLYTITDVDPLFFLLPEERFRDREVKESKNRQENSRDDSNRRKNNQWQPLDQILDRIDPILRSCVDPNQILNLYATMNLESGETFFKFSTERALRWLERKQKALEIFFIDQQHQQENQQTEKLNSSLVSLRTDGATFAPGFHIPADPHNLVQPKQESPTSSNDNDAKRVELAVQAKEDSIQIICSYLNEEWRNRFLEQVHATGQVLQGTSQQHRTKRAQASRTEDESIQTAILSESKNNDDNFDWMQKNSSLQPQKKSKKDTAMSSGIKKLAKVDTRGMKTMSAFFGASTKQENK